MDLLNFLAVDFGNAPSQPGRIATGIVGNSIPDWLNHLAERLSIRSKEGAVSLVMS